MMKKVQKLLTLGLCLALGAGALVACNKDKGGSGDGLSEGDLSNYWLAGKVKGVDGWDEQDAEGNNLVSDSMRFVRSAENGVYTLTLDLWKDDQFKIRYLGRGWDDEGGQMNATSHFDEDNNGDTVNGIAGQEGEGLGGKNFQVYKEGKYTVTINTTGDTPMVTWVRDGDATDKAPILATGVTLKDAEDQEVSTITLRVGESITLTATVAPADTTNKTIVYTSSNTDCFTVDNTTGVVTAVAVPTDPEEELELYVAVGSQAGLKTVPVTVLAADAVIVKPDSITIPAGEKTSNKFVGQTITVNPEVLPANTTNKAVTYSSNNPCVTVVSGVIKAVATGTAVVTATVGSGADAKTDTFTVNVAESFCLVGSSASADFAGASWKVDYNGVTDVPTGILFTQDAQDATKYTLDVNLYEGNTFKIVSVGMGTSEWGDLNHVIGGSTNSVAFVNTATTDTNITVSDSTNSQNISVTNSGKYRITVTLPTTGDATVTYKYLEAAAPLGITTDIRVKGDYNGWGATTLCKAELNPTHATTGTYTATFKLKYTGATKAFGIYTTATGGDTQIGWARDQVSAPTFCTGISDGTGNWMIAEGTYDVEVVIDSAANITSITFAVADNDTGAIEITGPAA
ncbi:MAG: Ig-like domain-containing protein [Roseburia sp.]|nr:Ig-like domain-containing protein [Roseburia sp.]